MERSSICVAPPRRNQVGDAMKLGLSIGYSRAHLDVPVDLVQRAEALGYDSVWTAEAYGSDAVTPLAFLAAKTRRIKLGTGVMQLAARTPANAAMSAATVDALAGGGRFIAGLGVSGPQIVEGWYGQPWGKPYWRVRDYVEIMRKIFARAAPVAHAGREISLPYAGPGAMGVGKPLRSILHMNPNIPIYLGTGNEAMVKLTAEIADGWLPLGFVPGALPEYRPWLEEGFRRAAGGKGFANFEIQASVHVEVNDDVKAALAKLKPEVALYVGGMGHRDKNFHKDMMIRRGYADAAERIQELFLAHRKQEAAAAVPDEWVDAKSLVGPPDRIKQRYGAWEESGATGLLVRGDRAAVEVMAQAAKLDRGRQAQARRP
jgi:F420-dependent oxidoreductase-like protein